MLTYMAIGELWQRELAVRDQLTRLKHSTGLGRQERRKWRQQLWQRERAVRDQLSRLKHSTGRGREV